MCQLNVLLYFLLWSYFKSMSVVSVGCQSAVVPPAGCLSLREVVQLCELIQVDESVKLLSVYSNAEASCCPELCCCKRCC